MNPNLLHISEMPPRINGAAIHSGRLLRGLARLGYGAHAIAPIAPKAPPAPRRCKETEGIDIQWLTLAEITFDKRNPPSIDAFCGEARAVAAVLPQAIDRVRPVAISTTQQQFLPGIPDLAHAHGLPCIVIVHSVVHRRFGGTFRDDIAALLLDEYRKADRIIAIADHVADSYRRSGCDNVACVPNSVDAETFRPGMPEPALRARLGIGENDLVVMHASNMVVVKRPGDVVAAAARSVRQDPRLQFVIAGAGQRLADMRAAVGEAGIADRVHFLGTVDPTDMPDLYRLADMVLMPSQSEGMSFVCLEALSAGCVLLASDIPASREIVSDGETGFLFPVGDEAAMSDLILRNAEDAGLRKRIGANARAWSLNRPTPDDNIASFDALFGETIAGHQRWCRQARSSHPIA